jgi:hypothetical protein
VDDPRYGRFTRGPVTEAESVAGLAFGLTKESEHPEQALDFLRFLASQPTNRLWSEKSGWLPAVVDTPVSDEIRPFLPTADGYPAGFVSGIQRSIFPSLRRVIETNAFRLYASNAGVDDFIASIRGGYQPAIHESLKRSLPARQDRVRNADLQLAARAWIEGDSASVDRLRQAALRNDRAFYLQRSMVESPSSPNP